MQDNFTCLKWICNRDCKLNIFLQDTIPKELNINVSNSKIRRLIISGNIKVNGVQCRLPAFIVKKGSHIEAFIDKDKLFYEKKPNDIDFVLKKDDVLFEDEYLIIVNKPAFIPTEKTIVADRLNMHQCVVDYLYKSSPIPLRNPPYAGIMHRLDRETSGTLLFTKKRAINPAIHNMFEQHTIQKSYRAVCACIKDFNANRFNKDFIIENYIDRISASSAPCKMGIVKQGGLYACTKFHITKIKDKLFYVDCTLLTGRTHQIRVHLSSIGLPLVGDSLYGGAKGFEQLNNRIMLHAHSLEFMHPVTNECIKVIAPLPALFE